MQIGPQPPRANRGRFNNYNSSPLFLIFKGEVPGDKSLQNRGHMHWITFESLHSVSNCFISSIKVKNGYDRAPQLHRTAHNKKPHMVIKLTHTK